MRLALVVPLIVLSMTLIVGGDVAGKILAGMGFPPVFIAWARFGVAAIILLPFAGLKRAELAQFLNWRLALRAALIVGGISCILTALKTEPIANVFGAFFVGPIVAYVLSVILLREQVTLIRSVLLVISFCGVLLVVRPGFGMTTGLALAFLAGCFHGGYLVATRWLAGSYRPRFLLYSQLVIGAIILAPFAMGPLPLIGAEAMVLLGLSALGSAAGNLILVAVNRSTPATVVAPLIYSQIIAATGFGWLQFGELPDVTGFVGLTIIIAAGAGSVWFARRR